jgi:hypothetical protein
MAGKALKRKILKEVAEKGGADYIYEVMASGKTITAWAAEDFGCSRSYLSRALRENPEYARAMDRALPEAADALIARSSRLPQCVSRSTCGKLWRLGGIGIVMEQVRKLRLR